MPNYASEINAKKVISASNPFLHAPSTSRPSQTEYVQWESNWDTLVKGTPHNTPKRVLQYTGIWRWTDPSDALFLGLIEVLSNMPTLKGGANERKFAN